MNHHVRRISVVLGMKKALDELLVKMGLLVQQIMIVDENYEVVNDT